MHSFVSHRNREMGIFPRHESIKLCVWSLKNKPYATAFAARLRLRRTLCMSWIHFSFGKYDVEWLCGGAFAFNKLQPFSLFHNCTLIKRFNWPLVLWRFSNSPHLRTQYAHMTNTHRHLSMFVVPPFPVQMEKKLKKKKKQNRKRRFAFTWSIATGSICVHGARLHTWYDIMKYQMLCVEIFCSSHHQEPVTRIERTS